MNDLIKVENGTAILDVGISSQLADFEMKIKHLKELEEKWRESILEEMEKKGIKKIETEDLTITYKAPYDKESFQSKEFRSDNPKLYDSYVKLSPVKASIAIKLKNE